MDGDLRIQKDPDLPQKRFCRPVETSFHQTLLKTYPVEGLVPKKPSSRDRHLPSCGTPSMRWDLIDRFEILKKGVCAKALKSFHGDEDFFSEHDPGDPRVPEPLMIEMIAQVGGVLFGLGIDFKKEVILAKIEAARFERAVAPPCEFVVEAKIEEEREEGAWVSGTVKLDGQTIATARILLVTIDSLTDSPGKKIVFNDRFLKHYDIYRVAKQSEGVGV